MYHRTLAGVGSVGKVAARRHGLFVARSSAPTIAVHHHAEAGLTTTAGSSSSSSSSSFSNRSPAASTVPCQQQQHPRHQQHHQQQQQQKQQACGLSSQASRKKSEGPERERKKKRTEEEARKVAEHKAAVIEYKLKMTALRKEIQKETADKRHAEAVSAALERRRIAKRQAAAKAEKKRKAAISIALNEKRKEKLKENYEAGFRESARIFFEREERKKNIHTILLEELEAESKHWISTPEDIAAKITDDLWEAPGNNSAGGQISMPDEHLWRFSADVGLYNQEEEPSERNAYLRSRMYSRMGEMHTAETYVRERRNRWDNDTRGLLKEADRLLRKEQPAPPGYMARLESSGPANRWKSAIDEELET